MSEHYNQNYSFKEISSVLQTIKDYILQNKYIIALNKNREENKQFVREYNLNSAKQKEILLSLQVEEFCHSLQNTNKGYEHEVLYVFCAKRGLYYLDELERSSVPIYLKFNILDSCLEEQERVVVISFYKLNKPIEYFKP